MSPRDKILVKILLPARDNASPPPLKDKDNFKTRKGKRVQLRVSSRDRVLKKIVFGNKEERNIPMIGRPPLLRHHSSPNFHDKENSFNKDEKKETPKPYQHHHRDRILKRIVFGSKDDRHIPMIVRPPLLRRHSSPGFGDKVSVSPEKTKRLQHHHRDRVLKKIVFGTNDNKETVLAKKKIKTEHSHLSRRHSARDRVLQKIIFGERSEERQHSPTRRSSF